MFKYNSLCINRKNEVALSRRYIILNFMQLLPFTFLGQLLQAGYKDRLVARKEE